MSQPKLACWQCAASIDNQPLPLSRQATCDACHYELHTCRQCQHYRADVTDRCFEDRAEVPNNKEVANFCEYFSPTSTVPPGADSSEGVTDKAAAARAKLDDLFS